MKYLALATDYDGTIACDGTVDDDTAFALQGARSAGLSLILVTGRELADLFKTFPHAKLFDRIVAENGAVLYDPAEQTIQSLAPPAAPALVSALQRARIPLSVGHSIVATVIPHEQIVFNAIRDLDLDWHVIFNKEWVMALPAGVSKATGLQIALQSMNKTAEQVVGVGDAENDLAFLGLCGLAVAVENALPEVRDRADLVIPEARGAGVRELIRRLIDNELDVIVPDPQKHVLR